MSMKVFIIAGLLVLGHNNSFAQSEQTNATQADTTHPFQPTKTPDELAERRSKLYEKRLGLNQGQYKNFYAVELDYWQKYQKIKNLVLHTSGLWLKAGTQRVYGKF